MKSKILIGLVFTFLLLELFSGMVSAYSTRNITIDAPVVQENPNTNYASNSLFVVSKNTNRNQRSYVLINSTGLILTSANFSGMVGTYTGAIAGISIYFYYCNDIFNENNITWNNQATEVLNCNSTPFYTKVLNTFTFAKYFNLTLSNQFLTDTDKLSTLKIISVPESYDATDRGMGFESSESASKPKLNYIGYSISPNATITAKSTYNGSTINSFSVRIQNGSTIRTQYTSTGTITTRINSSFATKYKYNITFYNNSNHFNKTYLNYNFSAHSNTIQGNLTRSFLYANVKSNFDSSSLTFNVTTGTTTYNNINKNTKIFLQNNNYNNLTFSAVNFKTQIVYNKNTSQNLTITLNRTYQYIFPRNKSNNKPIAYFNVSNGTYIYLNAQNTTKIYCYNTCTFMISSKDFMNSYFTKNSSTNKNINMTYAINKLYFKDNSATAIQGLLIQITYPSGYSLNRITNVAGMINFSSIPLTSNETGTYSFHVYDKIGYVTPLTFTETLTSANIPFTKNYTIYKATIKVNIFDRLTHNLLLRNVSLYFLTLFNDSTNTGAYSKTNISILANDYVAQALSSGYGTEQQTFTYNGISNVSIDFYLLNLSQSNVGTLFVSTLSSGLYKISGVRVILREYDPITLTFIEVSECISNSNGECAFNIELGTKTYDLIATKTINGQVYTASLEPEIIVTDNEVRNIYLYYSSSFTALPEDNLVYDIDETFLNNVSTISTNFYTINGLPLEICTEYFIGSVSITKSCLNSTSAIQNLGVSYLLNRSNYYVAKVYIEQGTTDRILETFYYPTIESIEETFPRTVLNAAILMAWVVCLAFTLYSKNITLFGILAIFLSWGSFFMLPNTLMVAFAVFKTTLSLSIVWFARKQQDTE